MISNQVAPILVAYKSVQYERDKNPRNTNVMGRILSLIFTAKSNRSSSEVSETTFGRARVTYACDGARDLSQCTTVLVVPSTVSTPAMVNVNMECLLHFRRLPARHIGRLDSHALTCDICFCLNMQPPTHSLKYSSALTVLQRLQKSVAQRRDTSIGI
ncbi:hypothetical protein BC835DRAFT_882614 [Cytidiella melzeri]|nr:hypothetical protein BC835DRAFT_882614 [Cytidiella melzeri]